MRKELKPKVIKIFLTLKAAEVIGTISLFTSLFYFGYYFLMLTGLGNPPKYMYPLFGVLPMLIFLCIIGGVGFIGNIWIKANWKWAEKIARNS